MSADKKVPDIRFKGFSGEWEKRSFGDCFNYIPNNTLSRAELNYEHGIARNIHYGDVLIKFGEILDANDASLPFITDEIFVYKQKNAALRNGDIVIADAAEDSTVGKCTELFNIDKQVILSGLHTIAIRPTVTFASKYLGYYLNSSSYHDQLLPLMQGTKVLSISKSALQYTNINFPNKNEEQIKIGNTFQKLDNLINQHQQKHDTLSNIKKAMLEKMFPKPGKTVPEIRFKGFNDEWEEKSVSQLGEIITGSTPSTQNLANYSNDGIPWVTPTDIFRNVTFNTAKRLSQVGCKAARIVPKNTILVTCIASIGKNTILGSQGSFNQQINGIVPNEKENNPYFLYSASALWSEKLKRSAASGTMQIVNKTEFSELKNRVPQKEEQTAIGNYFQKLDTLIEQHQQQITKLNNIKQACLSKMFI
ncbi:restriction endonuclease subunit S [Proteus vulgaris]|uniref:restriction endonuclease subunit S n=1 Tax=Proteus vulgaris TaxID=585 RepID=UPI0034D446EB